MTEIPKGVILSCSGKKLTSDEIIFFSKINPFGFILFSRNFSSKFQIKELIKSLKSSTLNKSPLVFVDQEGGRVQRLKGKGFKNHPTQYYFGELYKKNPSEAKDLAYINARIISHELIQVGVDVNCSPVIDVLFPYGNEIIGDRSFSSDPQIVSILGQEYCRGFKDGGIIPVLKHFPGHGRAKLDSHKALPIISENFNKLLNIDLKPFQALKNEPMLMIAHILYEKIDSNIAPYSKKIIIEILEKLMGYKGLTISDDLSMLALKGSLKTRTEMCFDGGCDVVLYCAGKIEETIEVYKSSKKIRKKKFEHFQNSINNINVKKINIKTLEEKLNESEKRRF